MATRDPEKLRAKIKRRAEKCSRISPDQAQELEPWVCERFLSGDVHIGHAEFHTLKQFTPAMQRSVVEQVIDDSFPSVKELLKAQFGYKFAGQPPRQQADLDEKRQSG